MRARHRLPVEASPEQWPPCTRECGLFLSVGGSAAERKQWALVTQAMILGVLKARRNAERDRDDNSEAVELEHELAPLDCIPSDALDAG